MLEGGYKRTFVCLVARPPGPGGGGGGGRRGCETCPPDASKPGESEPTASLPKEIAGLGRNLREADC